MSMSTAFLAGRTAWVTGASRGIGRAVAHALAGAGAEVCLGARSADALGQVAEAITAKGGRAHALALDVASWESCAAFAEEAVNLAGPPHLLVNNAGYGLFQDLDVMTAEEFEKQIRINLVGPWSMVKLAAPHLRRHGAGTIVNISSIAGRVGFKRGTAYCAAKAGLNMMGECLMQELREDAIRVVTIAPGSVESRFHRDALPASNPADTSWMLETDRIAEAVLHVLAAPEGTLVNYYEVRPLKPGKR